METPVCRSSVVSGKRKPPHFQQRLGCRGGCSFIRRPYTYWRENCLPVRSREGNLQRGDAPVTGNGRSKYPSGSNGERLPIRLHGRYSVENGPIEDVSRCIAFVQGGLCAFLDGGIQQERIRVPCEDDHGNLGMLSTRDQHEQDLKARHI